MTTGATAASLELQARVELVANEGQYASQVQECTAIAIFDGTQWASLCPELDIASCGEDAREAIVNLKHAVKEAITVAKEKGVNAGIATSPTDLFEFLREHKGPHSLHTEPFVVAAE